MMRRYLEGQISGLPWERWLWQTFSEYTFWIIHSYKFFTNNARIAFKIAMIITPTSAALLAGIFWGITGPLGEYLFENKGIVPEWLVPYRMLVTGAVMLSALYMQKKGSIFDVWKSRKDAIQMIVYGIAGMLTVQYSFFAQLPSLYNPLPPAKGWHYLK